MAHPQFTYKYFAGDYKDGLLSRRCPLPQTIGLHDHLDWPFDMVASSVDWRAILMVTDIFHNHIAEESTWMKYYYSPIADIMQTSEMSIYIRKEQIVEKVKDFCHHFLFSFAL